MKRKEWSHGLEKYFEEKLSEAIQRAESHADYCFIVCAH